MNQHQRRARDGWLCALCQQRRGHGRTMYCLGCVEQTRERYRCLDCTSVVTIAIAEGVPGLHVDLRHDASCPTWRAKKQAAS